MYIAIQTSLTPVSNTGIFSQGDPSRRKQRPGLVDRGLYTSTIAEVRARDFEWEGGTAENLRGIESVNMVKTLYSILMNVDFNHNYFFHF